MVFTMVFIVEKPESGSEVSTAQLRGREAASRELWGIYPGVRVYIHR